METEVLERTPVIVLEGFCSWDGQGEDKEIFETDLINAKVGDAWSSIGGSVDRGRIQESAKVVFADESGLAILITTDKRANNRDGTPSQSKRLVWVDMSTPRRGFTWELE